jgi:potassium-transporting ATPase KdpC subunit
MGGLAREIRIGVIAIVAFTLLLGLAYPLAMTGIGQVVFGDAADGNVLDRDGEPVGSSLIAQDFSGDDGYFQSRPSQSGYSAEVTFFNNLGPNSRKLARQIDRRIDAYMELEGPYNPGLEAADVPVDAVTTSASGVDPHISEANALIQANRVAEVRGLDLERVQELIDEHTSGRFLGVLGEPGVNVLEMNLALDEEEGSE